jgi:hypothetical protein
MKRLTLNDVKGICYILALYLLFMFSIVSILVLFDLATLANHIGFFKGISLLVAITTYFKIKRR